MKVMLRWISSRLNIRENPFNLFYWAMLIALIYVLVGIYGMNFSSIP